MSIRTWSEWDLICMFLWFFYHYPDGWWSIGYSSYFGITEKCQMNKEVATVRGCWPHFLQSFTFITENSLLKAGSSLQNQNTHLRTKLWMDFFGVKTRRFLRTAGADAARLHTGHLLMERLETGADLKGVMDECAACRMLKPRAAATSPCWLYA